MDGNFDAVVFNVGTTFVAVAYDDQDKVWEAVSKDALAKRASAAMDTPSRGAVFVVIKGKADVVSEDGTKARPAPAAYLRGLVYKFDKRFEMFGSYEPLRCPVGQEALHAAFYGKPPHSQVLALALSLALSLAL